MKKALESVAGVTSVDVDFRSKTATVTVDKNKKDIDALVKAVTGAGFKAKAKN